MNDCTGYADNMSCGYRLIRYSATQAVQQILAAIERKDDDDDDDIAVRMIVQVLCTRITYQKIPNIVTLKVLMSKMMQHLYMMITNPSVRLLLLPAEVGVEVMGEAEASKELCPVLQAQCSNKMVRMIVL